MFSFKQRITLHMLSIMLTIIIMSIIKGSLDHGNVTLLENCTEPTCGIDAFIATYFGSGIGMLFIIMTILIVGSAMTFFLFFSEKMYNSFRNFGISSDVIDFGMFILLITITPFLQSIGEMDSGFWLYMGVLFTLVIVNFLYAVYNSDIIVYVAVTLLVIGLVLTSGAQSLLFAIVSSLVMGVVFLIAFLMPTDRFSEYKQFRKSSVMTLAMLLLFNVPLFAN